MNLLKGALIVFLALTINAQRSVLAGEGGAASSETAPNCATSCNAHINPIALIPLDVLARKARFNQLKPGIPEDYLMAHYWCSDLSLSIPGAIYRTRYTSGGIFRSEVRYSDGTLKGRVVGQWSITEDRKGISWHYGSTTTAAQYRLDPDNGSLVGYNAHSMFVCDDRLVFNSDPLHPKPIP